MRAFRKILSDFADGIAMPRLGFFIRLSSVGLAFWSAEKGYSQGIGSSHIIDPTVASQFMLEPELSPSLNSDLVGLIMERLSDPTLTEFERSIYLNQLSLLRREEENEIPKHN
jgi:hypothetical protein